MNVITIAGRLGADAEIRYAPDGTKIITFSLATSRRRKGQQEETIWWRITLWGDRFDRMAPYFKKGSSLIITGTLDVRSYQDKEGVQRFSLDVRGEMVQFGPSSKPADGQPQFSQQSQSSNFGSAQKSTSPYQQESPFEGKNHGGMEEEHSFDDPFFSKDTPF